jgi:hypothetical protein
LINRKGTFQDFLDADAGDTNGLGMITGPPDSILLGASGVEVGDTLIIQTSTGEERWMITKVYDDGRTAELANRTTHNLYEGFEL